MVTCFDNAIISCTRLQVRSSKCHVQLSMLRKFQVEKKWSGQGLGGLGGCTSPGASYENGTSASYTKHVEIPNSNTIFSLGEKMALFGVALLISQPPLMQQVMQALNPDM